MQHALARAHEAVAKCVPAAAAAAAATRSGAVLLLLQHLRLQRAELFFRSREPRELLVANLLLLLKRLPLRTERRVPLR